MKEIVFTPPDIVGLILLLAMIACFIGMLVITVPTVVKWITNKIREFKRKKRGK